MELAIQKRRTAALHLSESTLTAWRNRRIIPAVVLLLVIILTSCFEPTHSLPAPKLTPARYRNGRKIIHNQVVAPGANTGDNHPLTKLDNLHEKEIAALDGVVNDLETPQKAGDGTEVHGRRRRGGHRVKRAAADTNKFPKGIKHIEHIPSKPLRESQQNSAPAVDSGNEDSFDSFELEQNREAFLDILEENQKQRLQRLQNGKKRHSPHSKIRLNYDYDSNRYTITEQSDDE